MGCAQLSGAGKQAMHAAPGATVLAQGVVQYIHMHINKLVGGCGGWGGGYCTLQLTS